MTKRVKPRRSPYFPNFTEAKFRPYVVAIGQAILAWNDLYEAFGFLYWSMTADYSATVPLAVWQSITNDRAKREMLMAAAKAHLGVDEKGGLFNKLMAIPRNVEIFSLIKWATSEANKLEEARNNAIHAPLWSLPGTSAISPASAFGNPRAKKLENLVLLEEYKRLRDTALQLRTFSRDLFEVIGYPQRPLPEKPQLPDRVGAKLQPQRHPTRTIKHPLRQ